MLTILVLLQNADYQLQNNGLVSIAKVQLHNAVVLLEKGYSLYDDFDALIEKYGDAESVPEKSDD
mgnify:CR=1 FL=1